MRDVCHRRYGGPSPIVSHVERCVGRRATTPYSLSAAWTYYLEAARDESWPSCDYRFLSYVDNASSTVANLWKDAGVNQQFIVNPRGNGRLTISALHGGTRLLTVGAGCVDDVVRLTDDDGAVVWEALPASDQPGHYFLRSVDRAGCSAEFLGFASTCDDQAPNGLKMVGQNGSSWRFFAAAPTTKVEHHAATPEPCADPFAWYAEDVQEYRLVCTGKTLPLYSAAHLGPNTTFTKLGGALGKQGYPAWLKRPARWAPENMMLTRPATTPSSLGHIAAAADIGLNSRIGETAAAAADDGRVNFMVVCDKQADDSHRIGYVVSRGGPRDHAWNEYSPTYLNLSAPEAGQIDPHLFRDPVSNATFLLYKSQDNRIHKLTTRLWIQRVHLDATNGTLEQLDESRVILNSTGLWWAPGFEGPKSTLVEGPEMMYYDGYYYLFFAGGKYCDDQYTEGVGFLLTLCRTPRSTWDASPAFSHSAAYRLVARRGERCGGVPQRSLLDSTGELDGPLWTRHFASMTMPWSLGARCCAWDHRLETLEWRYMDGPTRFRVAAPRREQHGADGFVTDGTAPQRQQSEQRT
jgi:hypothetical protein